MLVNEVMLHRAEDVGTENDIERDVDAVCPLALGRLKRGLKFGAF